jgi:hypothetical protein
VRERPISQQGCTVSPDSDSMWIKLGSWIRRPATVPIQGQDNEERGKNYRYLIAIVIAAEIIPVPVYRRRISRAHAASASIHEEIKIVQYATMASLLQVK